MKINILLGTLSGFIIAFLILSSIKKDFDWAFLVTLLISGIVGHFIAYHFSNKKNKNL